MNVTDMTMKASVLEEIRVRPLMSSQDFARLTDIDPRTVQNMCVRGEIKAVKVGRLWRINTADALERLGLN